jgi:HPt (histidine-containing phosphotransfer) domain-containing protein
MELPVVDKAEALGRLDGDIELWNEIRGIWLDDVPNLLAGVQAAFEARTSDGLRRASHALKGASANVGAARVAAVARELERASPEADWPALEILVRKLSQEANSARTELSRE